MERVHYGLQGVIELMRKLARHLAARGSLKRCLRLLAKGNINADAKNPLLILRAWVELAGGSNPSRPPLSDHPKLDLIQFSALDRALQGHRDAVTIIGMDLRKPD